MAGAGPLMVLETERRAAPSEDLAAVLAENLEPLEQLGAREPEHVLAGVEPAELRGRVVREDEPAVRVLRRDPVADVAQDRGELVGGRGDDLGLIHRIHCRSNNAFEPQTARSRASPDPIPRSFRGLSAMWDPLLRIPHLAPQAWAVQGSNLRPWD